MKFLVASLFFLSPLVLGAETTSPTNALFYSGPAWSPYLVGAGIGILSCLMLYFSDKLIGASSFYASIAGMAGKVIAPNHTASLKYYQDTPPVLNWALVFVCLVPIGSFISAYLGGEITNEWLPPMWIANFGDSIALRAICAIVGGILMGFGARLGGGCTSGQGISGTLQLNVGSWIVLACIFIGGISTAMILFKL